MASEKGEDGLPKRTHIRAVKTRTQLFESFRSFIDDPTLTYRQFEALVVSNEVVFQKVDVLFVPQYVRIHYPKNETL